MLVPLLLLCFSFYLSLRASEREIMIPESVLYKKAGKNMLSFRLPAALRQAVSRLWATVLALVHMLKYI